MTRDKLLLQNRKKQKSAQRKLSTPGSCLVILQSNYKNSTDVDECIRFIRLMIGKHNTVYGFLSVLLGILSSSDGDKKKEASTL